MIAPPFHPANRRVDVTLFPIGAPIPPPPAPDPVDAESRVSRLVTLLDERRVSGDGDGLKTSRMKCMLSKLKWGRDVFVDGSVANLTINGKTPKYDECVPKGRNAGWLGNYDNKNAPMDVHGPEFAKFLNSVGKIIEGSAFASSQKDEDLILSILGAVIQNIMDGMDQVDGYLARASMMKADPIMARILQSDGFVGDQARIHLQNQYRTGLNDPMNIYSCFR
jgi:hypothetical protein